MRQGVQVLARGAGRVRQGELPPRARRAEGGALRRARSRRSACRRRRATRSSSRTTRARPTRGPRRSATLKPAFQKDGTITAANASSINDGASALVLASEKAVKEHGPRAARAHRRLRRRRAGARVVHDRARRGHQEHARQARLDQGRRSISGRSTRRSRSSRWPSNQLVGLDPRRVNVRGGAVALGHPIGASGARILTTLLYAMKDRGEKRGLATLCIGGGEALAVVVERCNVSRPRHVARGVSSSSPRARRPCLPRPTRTATRWAEREVLLVEPATPYDDERREWLAWARAFAAAGRRLVGIVLTHHHEDHVGGAAFFADELGLPSGRTKRRPSACHASTSRGTSKTARSSCSTAPRPCDRACLHTPGHAPGHVCLFDEDAGTVIVGDMVASVGTILIEPNDGDMIDVPRAARAPRGPRGRGRAPRARRADRRADRSLPPLHHASPRPRGEGPRRRRRRAFRGRAARRARARGVRRHAAVSVADRANEPRGAPRQARARGPRRALAGGRLSARFVGLSRSTWFTPRPRPPRLSALSSVEVDS